MNSATFIGLAEALEQVRRTASKNEKVAVVAAYLRNLSPDDAALAARVASGRASERGSRDEAQVGYATLIEALREVTGATEDDVSSSYLKHGDLGEVAEELLAQKKEQPLFAEELSLRDIEEGFARLRSAKGKGAASTKRRIVKSFLLAATPLEGKYLVKALTGEMRTGLVTGLLEESIAAAYGLTKGEAARAHMVLGDVGAFAREAASGRAAVARIQPFRPVNFMLAEPFASAREIAEHFGKTAYAEYKYDGVRAQVHRAGGEVRVYSRRLEDITASFPEIVASFKGPGPDFIIDGEAVPFAGGRPLPFQLLQRRLRRLEDLEEAVREAPVTYFAFDILLRGDKETVDYPLSERRGLLRDVVEGTSVRLAETTDVNSEGTVQSAFRRSRDLGYEGLVVKDPESTYAMGKRGSGWAKLKEELDTLDVVIVAAEYGHGKRAGVISDYTFAVRDGDGLKTVGKAYSGLSDKEIGEMTSRLREITVRDYGYRRQVRPEIVVEVAFDSIQRSDRHDSGYALRFPRIKRIRTDKGIGDIDDIGKVRQVYSGQKLKMEEG
ncbi:MAG: ATP-dependent DNA ligase [Nitrososphaerota archaeon]|jgi:DNA ligase-1|nr:ATP-dependent DNA ligase [Nitrososphaerota archaeon]MDG6917529.1 ATP-dependent DNA ligase [Nitrososphaerota archaeon]MDG6948021.1 ATP-dependent DNA ligase [Nitrososphaerota archaeon]